MKHFKSHIYKTIKYLVCFMFLLSACKKQDDWLDVKNNKSDVTPKSLQDFQAVLDNADIFNSQSSIMGIVSSDYLYVPDAKLDAETQVSRNAYLWAKDIYQGAYADDWTLCYQQVEYANVVLDGLSKLSAADNATANANLIKGEALFYRAYAFYQLCQLYCKPYIKATAQTDLGVPLRLTSDVNQKVGRGTVQQIYDQMLSDLKIATASLPSSALYKTRPNNSAADALLAKIYLAMGDYTNAYQYSDDALKINHTLLNFNTLSGTSTAPFPSFTQGNSEVIFYAYGYGATIMTFNSHVNGRVSPDLFNSYTTGDLRKTLYFILDATTGLYRPKACYSAKAGPFCGIANDELYLIRAESAIRNGNFSIAQADINSLMQNRYTPAAYQPISINDANVLLNKILSERSKELALTGNLRWEDLRRLNQDKQFAKTLQRTYHSVNYTLPPGDNRYVLPIPNDEITLNNLQQNPR